jgi:capsule polysaccharide export protein KpsE/RkpR
MRSVKEIMENNATDESAQQHADDDKVHYEREAARIAHEQALAVLEKARGENRG